MDAYVQIPFVVGKEILNSGIQNLELGALVLVLSLLPAVLALDLALWGHRLSVALNNSNTVDIGLLIALMSHWHLIILEELHHLNDDLGEIVASLFVMLFARSVFSW
jgi:hypothetical protein